MKQWINSRIYRKMFINFLVMALVPLCLVSLYINSIYSKKIKEDTIEKHRLVEKNVAIRLDDYLTKIEYITDLFFSDNVQAILKKTPSPLSNYYNQVLIEKNIRVKLDLFGIMNNVDQVSFLKEDGTSYHVMNAIKSLKTIPFEYSEVLLINSYKNQTLVRAKEVAKGNNLASNLENKYVYIRRIDDVQGVKGVLGYTFIVIDKEEFNKIFNEIQSILNTKIILENIQGKILYSNFKEATFGALEKDKLIHWKYNIRNLHLSLRFYDDTQYIDENLKSFNNMVLTIMIITILIILILSMLFARNIVKPIAKLHGSILGVKSGNFKVRATVETTDELGDLCEAFNDMTGEIDRLVNKVYTIQLKEQEAMIAALQSQINPHFLYNTLDMIKSMADIYGVNQVSEVIVALSSIFRYATHSSHFIVTIQEEINNLENYMMIVNTRFGGNISYEVIVPKELTNHAIVKVCLQPIVENAISHGLGRTGNKGEIKVIFQKVAEIIIIKVIDNGIGISKEKLEAIRKQLAIHQEDTERGNSTNVGSVGLKNIHDRIRLYYGENYGVAIESTENVGTTIYIKYPDK